LLVQPRAVRLDREPFRQRDSNVQVSSLRRSWLGSSAGLASL
jgi:hypothetical protein